MADWGTACRVDERRPLDAEERERYAPGAGPDIGVGRYGQQERAKKQCGRDRERKEQRFERGHGYVSLEEGLPQENETSPQRGGGMARFFEGFQAFIDVVSVMLKPCPGIHSLGKR